MKFQTNDGVDIYLKTVMLCVMQCGVAIYIMNGVAIQWVVL